MKGLKEDLTEALISRRLSRMSDHEIMRELKRILKNYPPMEELPPDERERLAKAWADVEEYEKFYGKIEV